MPSLFVLCVKTCLRYLQNVDLTNEGSEDWGLGNKMKFSLRISANTNTAGRGVRP